MRPDQPSTPLSSALDRDAASRTRADRRSEADSALPAIARVDRPVERARAATADDRTDAATDAPLTLVIAANGKTGRRVAERLERRGVPVRRGSRTAPIPFDWDDEATWAPALDGVRRAYVVYTPDLAVPGAPEAIARFTTLAKRRGVERLVLLSGRGEEEAQRCERIVAQSGLAWTVVRASWFLQNFSEGEFVELVRSGTVALPAGDVREPFVDCDDVADVAVAALVEDGHAGRVYEVTGPRAWTFAEAVAEIARTSGRDVHYARISPEDFDAGLAAAGVPDDARWLLDYLFTTVLDGRNEATTDGVREALGREPRGLADFVRDAEATGVWSAAREEVRA